MPLVRKTRPNGNNMVVAIPSQIAQAFDITKGDLIEVISLKNGEIKIKKLEKKNENEK